jgi:hypothetical protein
MSAPPERAVRTLKSLRDEVGSGHAASHSTLLCHAMMIVAGEDVSEAERRSAWTDFGVVKRDQTIYPIEGVMGRGRFQCYFGHADTGLISRFENQARRLYSAALEVLGPKSFDYYPLPFGLGGWVYLCYCMAWDHHDRVDYEVEFEAVTDYERASFGTKGQFVEPGLFSLACYGTRSPFVDRGTFTSWPKSAAEYADGVFFGRLSLDVRHCSVSAVDAILDLSAASGTATKPRRRSDPENEARDQWVYEQRRDGAPFKTIKARMEKEFGYSLTEARLGAIAWEYAVRHNLPPVESSCGRRRVRGAGESGRA